MFEYWLMYRPVCLSAILRNFAKRLRTLVPQLPEKAMAGVMPN
jgi:hypothetical protein